MSDSNDRSMVNEDVLDADLERLIKASMRRPVRPMHFKDINMVVEKAASLQGQGNFPFLALVGLAGCLGFLFLAGILDRYTVLPITRWLLVGIPMLNLLMAPFAALVIIWRRRRTIHDS